MSSKRSDPKQASAPEAADPFLALLDPFHFWRNLAPKLGDSANQLSNKAFLESEELSALASRAAAVTMTGKRKRNELIQRYMEAMNLPTRADTQLITEKLTALEDRLIALATAVEGLARASSPQTVVRSGPARTRKPPPELPPEAEAAPAPAPEAAPAAAVDAAAADAAAVPSKAEGAPAASAPRRPARARNTKGSAQ